MNIKEYRELQKKSKKRHKYNAKATMRDGFYFGSTLEANYYDYLKLLKAAGEVEYFLRQVPFHLPGNVTYRVDFQVFYMDGHHEYVDTKGRITKEFIRNQKQVEHLNPVKIKVVTKIPTFKKI